MLLIMLAAAMAGEPYELRWGSEVFKQGDDRTAKSMESWLGDQATSLGPCRDRGLDAGESPIRYLALKVSMKLDGTVKKLDTITSSQSATTDACVTDLLASAVLTPAPMFQDVLRVNITWVLPEEPTP